MNVQGDQSKLEAHSFKDTCRSYVSKQAVQLKLKGAQCFSEMFVT